MIVSFSAFQPTNVTTLYRKAKEKFYIHTHIYVCIVGHCLSINR